jgi:hypothetical protein
MQDTAASTATKKKKSMSPPLGVLDAQQSNCDQLIFYFAESRDLGLRETHLCNACKIMQNRSSHKYKIMQSPQTP